MLPFLALFLRAGIQFAITFGISEFVVEKVLPLVNNAIEAVMVKLGVPEEQAKDILSNEILQFVEEVGIGAATLRTKLPIKIAEMLGFTTKGWALRKLLPQVALKVEAAGGTIVAAAEKGVAQLAEEFGVKAAKKGVVAATGKTIGDFLMSKVGLSLGFLYVLANFLDFAAWPGSAFQGTFQAIFKIFGLKPDQSAASSKVLSDAMWNKIWNTYKTLGATGITNPDTGEVMAFNTTNMIAVVDKIAAGIIAEKGKVTTQELIGALQGLMIFSSPVTESKINNLVQSTATTPTGTEIKQTGTAAKIFTGVVSQGTLGTSAEFTPREDDLIESQEELQVAAQNNLAIFLTALPAKTMYELKIVNTVTLKDGTKKYGTEQQIISGYKANGTPKYKTVKNKFAVLDIYIFTDRNVRSKISQIVLGPTDSVKLNPSLKNLVAISTSIQNNIIVNDTKEIENVTVSIPTTQQTTTPKVEEQTYKQTTTTTPTGEKPYYPHFVDTKTDIAYAMGPFNTETEANLASAQFFMKWLAADPNKQQYNFIQSGMAREYFASFKTLPIFTEIQTQQPQAIQIPASTNPNKCNAQSIAEFFDPNKISYPSLTTRGQLYESFGLGLAAYYTGTAEQNTKLLNELKKRVGCTI